ncbi:hypothetical protein [Pyrococcus kukulkanii]|nr:hypothetical protein [Pyrococcus kukulkanii]
MVIKLALGLVLGELVIPSPDEGIILPHEYYQLPLDFHHYHLLGSW